MGSTTPSIPSDNRVIHFLRFYYWCVWGHVIFAPTVGYPEYSIAPSGAFRLALDNLPNSWIRLMGRAQYL